MPEKSLKELETLQARLVLAIKDGNKRDEKFSKYTTNLHKITSAIIRLVNENGENGVLYEKQKAGNNLVSWAKDYLSGAQEMKDAIQQGFDQG